MDDDLNFQRVQKDMSQFYVEQLSSLINMIDEIRLNIVYYPKLIISLNERLHSLYLKLIAKMTPDEIIEETGYITSLEKLRIMKTVYYDNVGQRLNPPDVQINNNAFIEYKKILEKREIHLNKVMERVGLTNVQRSNFINY